MPSFEWHVEWGDLIGALGALILLGGALFIVWRTVTPIATKITRAVDLLLGRPAEQGIPALPSMVERIDEVKDSVRALDAANTERLDAQNDEIAQIKAQVTPNHGSTNKLSEDVQGITAALNLLTQRFDEHLRK